MNAHTSACIQNLVWVAVAMSMVVMAWKTTGSLHSFWFLGVYFLGHHGVEIIRPEKEPQDGT